MYSFCIYTVSPQPPPPPGVKIVVVVVVVDDDDDDDDDVIIIIIILVITIMQGIYNYMPETNHVSRVYRVAAVLYSESVLHVMLFCP